MDVSAQETVKPVEDQAMEFALKKLESYGFHTSRCSEALVKADHDVGKAFEILMTELFQLSYDIPSGVLLFFSVNSFASAFQVLSSSL